MRLLANILDTHWSKIQVLIQENKYNDLSHFLSAAIENQLLLEQDDISSITFPEVSEPLPAQLESSGANMNPSDYDWSKVGSVTNDQLILQSPPRFDEVVYSTYDYSEDETWIWGQVNKYLPIKIAVRVLLRLQAQQGGAPVLLSDFAKEATEAAVAIGGILRKDEQENRKGRDRRLSTALPKKNDEKSENRYQAHFLGFVRRDRKLDGALNLLRLARVVIGDRVSEHKIGLTQQGKHFAQLQNPVLDDQVFDKSLSQQEREFLVSHLKSSHRGESKAILWLLNSIQGGTNQREALNKKLSEDYAIWKATPPTINTQRAGLTSRVTELGLLDRTKDGVVVTYHVTEKGKQLIQP